MKHTLFFAALTSLAVSVGAAAAPATPAKAAEPEYVDAVTQWRDTVEKNLRRDNGWLTLAGRFIMKPGVNTFGTASNNDIVFPAELKGAGPEIIGTITVDPVNKSVKLKLADGVSMTSDGKPFTGERVLKADAAKRDWVSLGRISMHVIERDGRYVLRLADNESMVRKSFPGRASTPRVADSWWVSVACGVLTIR